MGSVDLKLPPQEDSEGVKRPRIGRAIKQPICGYNLNKENTPSRIFRKAAKSDERSLYSA